MNIKKIALSAIVVSALASTAMAAPAGIGTVNLLSQQGEISGRYNTNFENVMGTLAKIKEKASPTLGENRNYTSFNSAYEALKTKYDTAKSTHSDSPLNLTNSLREMGLNDVVAKAHTLAGDTSFISLDGADTLKSELDTNSLASTRSEKEFSENLVALGTQAEEERKKEEVGTTLGGSAITTTSTVLREGDGGGSVSEEDTPEEREEHSEEGTPKSAEPAEPREGEEHADDPNAAEERLESPNPAQPKTNAEAIAPNNNTATSEETSSVVVKTPTQKVYDKLSFINKEEVAKSEEQKMGVAIIANNPELARLVTSAKEFKEFSKNVKQNVDTVSTLSQKVVGSGDVVLANSSLNSSVRLAMLSNGGYPVKVAEAKRLEQLSNLRFADASSRLSYASDAVEAYTDRFNYDNNIYATLLGGGGKIKGVDGSPNVFGITIGMDTASDFTIYGANINYLRSSLSGSTFSADTDTYALSFYTRSFFDDDEMDFKVDFGLGKNKLETTTMLGANPLKSKSDFNSTMFDTNLTYGRIFMLYANYESRGLIKPYIGLGYNLNKASTIDMDGSLKYSISGARHGRFYSVLGAEYRGYFDNSSYIFINPSIQVNLVNKTNDQELKMVGEEGVKLDKVKKNRISYSINAGVDFRVSQNTRINLAAGYRGNKDSNFGTVSATLKYEF